MNNIIIGRKPLFKFWSRVLKKAKKQVDKRQEVELRFDEVIFPTAFCCIIRYEIVNSRRKFEYVLQGNYSAHYLKTSNEEEVDISTLNLKELITRAYLNNEAREINL